MKRKFFIIGSALVSFLLLTQGTGVSASISDSSIISYTTISDEQFFMDIQEYPLVTDIPSTTLPNNTVAPDPEGGCGMSASINITSWYEQALGMATNGAHLFIVGYDYAPGHNQWRIEKRDFKTGVLSPGFGPNGNGEIQRDLSPGSDIAYAIAIDQNAMYVIGAEIVLNQMLEKIMTGNGALRNVI